MMEKRYAKFFIGLVKELIPQDVEKEKLFEALKRYQSSQDIDKLLADLRTVINEPNKLELYEFMRPLILLRHQIEYSRKTPANPGVKLRTVRLHRSSGDSLGFAVRGGYEHSVGIFVSEVAAGSQADKQGLRVGDEIVRLNGFTISEAIHDEVLSLIKARDDVTLRVTYIGMLPVKENPSDPVTWKYVDSLEEDKDEVDGGSKKPPRDIKIFIDSTGHASLGCGIMSASSQGSRFPGIFVEKVREGSIAEQVGLEPGDQILEVNERSFRNITWKEAVVELKSRRQLNIVIRKKGGIKLVQRLSSSLPRGPKSAEIPANENIANTEPAPPPEPSEPIEEEPVYSVVNKPPKQPVQEKSLRPSAPEPELDETALILQQLNMRPLFRSPPETPASPSQFSRISDSSSVVSTSAEVHASPSSPTSQTISPDHDWRNNRTSLQSYEDSRKSGDDQILRNGINETSPRSSTSSVSSSQNYDKNGGLRLSDNFSFSKSNTAAPSTSFSTSQNSNKGQALRSNGEVNPHVTSIAALGGAAAREAERRLQSGGGNRASLLGPQGDYEWTDQVSNKIYDKFGIDVLDGRPLRCLTYKTSADLGVDVEGGLGSPIGGKILVAVVFDGGIAQKSGKIRVGDQLLMVNGRVLTGVTAAEAEKIIQGVTTSGKDRVELYYCESTLVNDEDSVTYF